MFQRASFYFGKGSTKRWFCWNIFPFIVDVFLIKWMLRNVRIVETRTTYLSFKLSSSLPSFLCKLNLCHKRFNIADKFELNQKNDFDCFILRDGWNFLFFSIFENIGCCWQMLNNKWWVPSGQQGPDLTRGQVKSKIKS